MAYRSMTKAFSMIKVTLQDEQHLSNTRVNLAKCETERATLPDLRPSGFKR